MCWGTDRIAKVLDLYDEYESLVQKKNAEITDYSDEITALWAKYDTAVDNFKASLNDMMDTLASATVLLKQVKAQLSNITEHQRKHLSLPIFSRTKRFIE